MKNVIIKLLVSTALTATVLSSASAKNLLIGLSPNMEENTAENTAISLLKFVAQNTSLGERVVFFDGYNLNEICSFYVPNRPAYRHVKSKLSVNAKCIRQILDFAETKQTGVSKNAIRLPQFAMLLSQHYPSKKPIDVLVYGSPLYDDPKEIGFSMLQGHVPSDGHIAASLNASPYGLAGPGEAASNMSFHMVTGDDDWRLNAQHGYLVKRFWTLYLEQLGGSLVSLTPDSNVAFTGIISEKRKGDHNFKLTNLDKLEMIPVRRTSSARALIHNREISQTVPSAEEVRAAQNIEMGISWDCKNCDLDLYARPYRGAEILYFKNTNSAEGQFFKDFRETPEISNGLESIEFTKSIDLRKLFIAVNHYGGNAPNGLITGEIRLSLGNKTYAKPFLIKSRNGSKGKGGQEIFGTEKAPNKTWAVIQPLKIVGFQ